MLKFVNGTGFEPAQLSTLELLLTQSAHHMATNPIYQFSYPFMFSGGWRIRTPNTMTNSCALPVELNPPEPTLKILNDRPQVVQTDVQ